MLRDLILTTAAVLAALLPFTAAASPSPNSISGPVAPPLAAKGGTGLCIASAASADDPPAFNTKDPDDYKKAVNDFLNNPSTLKGFVIYTLLDLSNSFMTTAECIQPSCGDFKGVEPTNCAYGGCGIYWSASSSAFASRLRGYMNVTEGQVNVPIHIGLFADDSVSLAFYSKTEEKPIVTHPPSAGSSAYRMTNTVMFQEPGLYPIEILYANISEHAALEMSLYIGSFDDLDPTPMTDSASLQGQEFSLLDKTRFYQTLTGLSPFQDHTFCKQCARESVNTPGGCGVGYYCNDAALCAPCNLEDFCGPKCEQCTGTANPFCLSVKGEKACAQCRNNADCKSGLCDPIDHVCQPCVNDNDCERGNVCVDAACVPCDLPERCAGNSCSCCPPGRNGRERMCEKLYRDDPLPSCVECLEDKDCGKNVPCDARVGYCVDEVKAYTDECCGETCVKCPEDYPFCLPGPVGTACAQCRNDADCQDGKYCLSGQCRLCVHDRRCGARCESCGKDKPYCSGQNVDHATCVRCTGDSQCPDGKCNVETSECEPECAMSCPSSTPRCFGTRCVECYADSQCPCKGSCDLITNTCSASCKDNQDCLGAEHCRWKEDAVTKECAPGPMPGDVACGGTLFDDCSACMIGAQRGDAYRGKIATLTLLALLARRRMREAARKRPVPSHRPDLALRAGRTS